MSLYAGPVWAHLGAAWPPAPHSRPGDPAFPCRTPEVMLPSEVQTVEGHRWATEGLERMGGAPLGKAKSWGPWGVPGQPCSCVTAACPSTPLVSRGAGGGQA